QAWVCGHVLAGDSKLAPSTSPGCWTATRTDCWSSVTSGPQVSAPSGTVRNCWTWPRDGPSTGTRKSPSLEPSALPSVETHRLPTASKATLSGQLIGLTNCLGKPANQVSGACGSPQTSIRSQVKVLPVWPP